jgi:hypothetical protein
VTASQSGEIEVEDQLEWRIRKPVDLVRCVLACIEVVVLAVASATTAGVETDIVDASRRLPHALLVVAPPLALFGLLILPVAMAVQWLVRRQFGRPGPPVRIRQSRTLGRRRPAAFLSHGISSRACRPRAITRGSQNQIGRSETGHHPAGVTYTAP